MREVIYEEDNVVLEWETADETDIVGFHIYRKDPSSGALEQLTRALWIAQKSGSSSGAAYRYVDETAQAGVEYNYILGTVSGDGLERRTTFGDTETVRTVDAWFVYLPITMK